MMDENGADGGRATAEGCVLSGARPPKSARWVACDHWRVHVGWRTAGKGSVAIGQGECGYQARRGVAVEQGECGSRARLYALRLRASPPLTEALAPKRQ